MLHLAIFYGMLFAACGYALLRGGSPERIIAATMLAGVASTRLALSSPSVRYRSVETWTFAIDLVVLLVFVIVSMRADRRWPMAVAVLHGLSVAAHAVRIVSPDMIRVVYKTIMVAWIYPQLVILMLGVLHHRRRLISTGTDPSWSNFSRRS